MNSRPLQRRRSAEAGFDHVGSERDVLLDRLLKLTVFGVLKMYENLEPGVRIDGRL